MTLGDGAWSWFADPRAVHDPQRAMTYVGWVARNGDVKLAAYDHSALVRTTVDLHPGLQVDDHANPAIQLLPDGRIRVFYSAHAGSPLYYRTSVQAGSVTAWDAEQTVPGNTPGTRGYTYPNPVRLATESRTYLFWRGGNFNPTFATQEDGSATWSAPRNLIFVAGQRPYVKYDSDGLDTIHIAFTNAHPRESPDVNLYYVAYRAGELRHADGTRAGTPLAPISPSDADLVYDGRENTWVHDVAHGPDGRPVIVFARFPSLDDHRYMYARWTGRAWSAHEIVAAGGSISGDGQEHQYSAGITLDHEDPSVVYLSRPVAGTYEIETWRTPDGGATWSHAAVTVGSEAANVRPVSPRGLIPFSSDLALVWMHGVYSSYVDYKTSLRTAPATGGHEPPLADIELAPRSGPAPQEVAFDGRASADGDRTIVDWEWDFGDGEHGTGAAVRHIYAAPGRYFPALTVRDDAGARDVAVEEVVVGPVAAAYGARLTNAG
jgi:BNR repeat-containing family member/PKD domain